MSDKILYGLLEVGTMEQVRDYYWFYLFRRSF